MDDPVVVAKLMHYVSACAYSSFFLTAWDWFTTLNFETLVIWRKATDPRVRWTYFVSRYLGLMAQVANSLIVTFFQFSRFSTQQHCRIWYGFQLAISVALLFTMDYNLILRIRALYTRNRYINIALFIAVTIESFVFIVCGSWAIGVLSFSNDGACLPMRAPPQVLYLTAAQMLTQTILLLLIYYQSIRIFFRTGWFKIPLVSLVARDGFGVFMLFMALLTGMVYDTVRRVDGIHNGWLCYFAFPLYVCLVSLASCRITMNIKTFVDDDDDGSLTDSVEFNTIFTASAVFSE